jgi:hypothetical protein
MEVAITETVEMPLADRDKKPLAEPYDFVHIADGLIQEESNMARYGSKYGKPNRNWAEDLKKVEEIKSRICLK